MSRRYATAATITMPQYAQGAHRPARAVHQILIWWTELSTDVSASFCPVGDSVALLFFCAHFFILSTIFTLPLKLRMCFKTETAMEFTSYDLNIAANKIIIISCATRWNWRLVTSGFNERCRICTVNICMTAQGKIIGKIGKIIVATFSGNQLHTFVTRFWPHCGWNVPKHRDLKMLEIF